MTEKSHRLLEVRTIVNNYLQTLKEKPQMLGSLDNIEGAFYLLDQLYITLNYGEENNVSELSWMSFLSFKGIGGVTKNATPTLKNTTNPFQSLIRLRDEYYRWIEIKISHKRHPDDSPLTKILETANERESFELLSWFSKYPSTKAIKLYSDLIKNNYIGFPEIARGLARMGDANILTWSICQITKKEDDIRRKLAIECLAVSPLKKADCFVKNIINEPKFDDIESLICAFGNSANKNKFEHISQIISQAGESRCLISSIELVLRTLIHENKEQSFNLLKKIGIDNP